MPLARYKDLCIDAVDPGRSAAFWASVLGLEPGVGADGVAALRASDGLPVVWINPVPEPKTVKNRVHIDINTVSVDDVVAAGASEELEQPFRWRRMLDPDGQEFCAFIRKAPIASPLYELGWDCADSAQAAQESAAWWAELLGARVVDDVDHGYSYIEDIPGSPWESFDFIPVPEPKTVKNRVHVDVWADDIDELLRRGATLLRAAGSGTRWAVLADPVGNEFCAFCSDG